MSYVRHIGSGILDRVQTALLVRSARLDAGLTQAQLAGRAGTSQAAVSAYESGRRNPSSATLERLVAAAGASLAAAPDQPLPRDRLRARRAEVVAALQRHGASEVAVFGSVARGDDTAESDIDLLVTLPEGAGLFEIAGLGQALSDILGVPVDVCPRAMLKPGLRRAAEREAVPL